MVETSLVWAELERRASPLLTFVRAVAVAMMGATEPQRMRSWPPAWAMADVGLRRRWLQLVGIDPSSFTDRDIESLMLIEVGYGGRGCRCRPDLAFVWIRPTKTRVLAILEAKSRSEGAINAPPISALGATEVSELPPNLRPWCFQSKDGSICVSQFDVYRLVPEVYAASWDLGGATYVLVTPGNRRYTAPEGWIGADSEEVAVLLLQAAEDSSEVSVRDIFARAVGAQTAPPGTRPWKGVTSAGRIISYGTFGLARSWAVWKRELKLVYLAGVGFGLAMGTRGWMPVDFDGDDLDPAALPAEGLAAYAEALAAHGDRAGWLPCPICANRAELACGHVDRYGSHIMDRPLVPGAAGPAEA